jgi:hypothetical protein
MRLGIIRNNVVKTVNSADQIAVQADAVFGGQAYSIKAYDSLILALEVVSEQEWNDIDFAPVQAIIDNYDIAPTQTITNSEYEQLNSYIAAVNQKLPVFLGIIRTMVQEQDPKVINIKLPESIINDSPIILSVLILLGNLNSRDLTAVLAGTKF